MAESGPKTAVKDLNLSLLDGLMNLKVDALPTKRAAETVSFKIIVPLPGEPVQPKQMYVHPDDIDSAKAGVRMWSTVECERAREIDGILHRVTPEEIDAAKEPAIEKGEIALKVFDATAVEATTRPSGALYTLRPKAVPHVYAMLVDLVADTSLAFIGEMTVRDVQRLYRLTSWNGALLLQECIRPGEFYDPEDYSHDYPSPLLAKMKDACTASLGVFDPTTYTNHLREQAAALDAAKRDPNAPVVKPAKAAPVRESVDDLMAMLDTVAAKAKPAKGKSK